MNYKIFFALTTTLFSSLSLAVVDSGVKVVVKNNTQEDITLKIIRSDPKGVIRNYAAPDQNIILKKGETSEPFSAAKFTGDLGETAHQIKVAYIPKGKAGSFHSIDIDDIIKKAAKCNAALIQITIAPGKLFGFDISYTCA